MADGRPGGVLAGLRIATTREHAGDLDEVLAHHGAVVTHVPLIEIVPPEDNSALVNALGQLAEYQWLVLTSANALRTMPAGENQWPVVACVGETTAARARAFGMQVELIPQRRHVKGLIEAFAGLKQAPGRVLYPRSEIASSTLKEGLQALGYSVDDPVSYRTLPHEPGMKKLQSEIDNLDAIAFASPSAADNAWQSVGEKLANKRIYSIGPSTSQRLREHGLGVTAEAAVHSSEGLVQAIIENE